MLISYMSAVIVCSTSLISSQICFSLKMPVPVLTLTSTTVKAPVTTPKTSAMVDKGEVK